MRHSLNAFLWLIWMHIFPTSLQSYLRDAGCLLRLQHLIVHPDRSVRLAAIAAIGNLALNTGNQKEMQVRTITMHV